MLSLISLVHIGNNALEEMKRRLNTACFPATVAEEWREGVRIWASAPYTLLSPKLPATKVKLKDFQGIAVPKNIPLQTVAITYHSNHLPRHTEHKDTAVAILGWSREAGSSQKPWVHPKRQGQGLAWEQGLSLPLCQAESQPPNLLRTGHQLWCLTVLHNVLVLIRSS